MVISYELVIKMKSINKKTAFIALVISLLFFAGCTSNEVESKKATTTSVAEITQEPPIKTTTTLQEAPYQTSPVTVTTIIPQGSTLVTGLSSEGFLAKYKDFAFKIDRFIYSADYEITGVVLDVKKPDGTFVQVQATKMTDGAMGNMVIKFIPEYSVDDGTIQKGAVYVYETA